MKLKNYCLTAFLIGFAVFVLTGCPPKKKMKIEEKPVEEVTEQMKEEEVVEVEKGVKITSDWTEIPALAAVTFAYDSAQLTAEARAVLKSNVAILKKLPGSVTIRVEGHCDDRGTIEYNIALGQRRANALSTFYATSGIAKNKLQTISFGEERPLCTEAIESCWAKNRRGATKVRNDSPIIFDAESAR